jgi:CheY-like chemotaxis protein
MQMPEMDGIELTHAIRRLRQPEELKIIMLTSLGAPESEFKPVPFSAYLTKPVKPRQLFNVLLAVLQGAPKERDNKVTAESAIATPATEMPMSMLLAEDNRVNQKVALKMLKRLGYDADLAENGLEVLEALKHKDYDDILMDIHMPEMDGLETTRYLKKNLNDDKMPCIVALTADAFEEDIQRCIEAGMDLYLGKPVTLDKLIETLGICFDSRKSRSVARGQEEYASLRENS